MHLDCGLRLNEVLSLKIGNVDFRRRCILVNGKGRKQRIVPMGAHSFDELSLLLELDPRPAASPLFQKADGKPITATTVKQMFRKLKKRTGIDRLHPHLLRHTFATNYIINGGNLETLRILLGHSSINITQVYLHLANSYSLLHQQFISNIDNIYSMNSDNS